MSTTLAAPTAAELKKKELAKSAHGLLESLKSSIKQVLPKHLTPERMAMIAFTAMRQNPALMECSRESIIGSIMTASILGLEPSGPLGHGALIPYKGECQFQPMYQGLLDLARRSGFIRDVQLRAVYKGDTYKYAFGLDPTIEHIPLEGEGASNPDRVCTHVYCIIRFVNGGIQWDQMSFEQAMAHGKKFSKTWNTRDYPNKFKPNTPWAEHPVAMCLKTILKQTLKLCPKSPEMAQAMQIDDITETGRTASLKKTEEGYFDVEFGGSDDEPAPVETKGTVNIEDLKPGKEGNRGHGNENLADLSNKAAPAETKSQTPGAEDLEAKCTDLMFDELETIQTQNDIDPRAFIAYVKETLGYKMKSHLKQKDFLRAKAWLKNGGKE
jgi:recombination protein RecT